MCQKVAGMSNLKDNKRIKKADGELKRPRSLVIWRDMRSRGAPEIIIDNFFHSGKLKKTPKKPIQGGMKNE